MIFITGDMHGDKSRFQKAKKAHIKKQDSLIVCGDFGFIWKGTKKEQAIVKWIGKRPYQTLFVDGCNENHKLLAEYPVVSFYGGKARKISGNLYQLLRGEIYDIDGKRIFAFGGGDTLEKFTGNPEDPALLPSCEEMEHANVKLAACGDKVDLIVTHDAPARVKSFINMESNELDHLHAFLEDICQTVQFKHWYFGKYHANKRIPPCYHMLFTDVVKIEDK